MHKPKKSRASRARPGGVPKGAYRLPTGGYVTKPVTGSPDAKGRRIAVVGVRRDPVDLELLAKALLQLADDVRRQQQFGDVTEL